MPAYCPYRWWKDLILRIFALVSFRVLYSKWRGLQRSTEPDKSARRKTLSLLERDLPTSLQYQQISQWRRRSRATQLLQVSHKIIYFFEYPVVFPVFNYFFMHKFSLSFLIKFWTQICGTFSSVCLFLWLHRTIIIFTALLIPLNCDSTM